MKILKLATALICSTPLFAHATPITYSFSATYSFELDSTIGPPPRPILTPVTDPIFQSTDIFAGTFSYDNETPIFLAVPNGPTLFTGAVTDFAGRIGDYSVVVPTATASIVPMTRMISFVGPANSFSIGDWSSPQVSLSWNNFTDTSLPESLPLAVPSIASLSLNLTNAAAGTRRQIAFTSISITQVPEPSGLYFLTLGTLLVVGVRLRTLYLQRE